MSPFEVVHGYKPRKPTDLIPLPQHARVSITAESFAQHIKELHENIRNHINKSNEIYKGKGMLIEGTKNSKKEIM